MVKLPREDIYPYTFASGVEASLSFRQSGQYQGAGVFTGYRLRLRHLAQRNRLPLIAVFGRAFFPVLGKFFAIGTSILQPPTRRTRISSTSSMGVTPKSRLNSRLNCDGLSYPTALAAVLAL